jgi:CCR4-NOT transcriptional regulation complex NOT5 subunit
MLSECILTGRILSTLGTEYDIFQDVWDTIPTSNKTVNLLIEKLCAVELRTDKLVSAEAAVFVAHENDKKKSNSTKVNSCKSTKRGADRAKQKFPCNQCKQLIHWAAECPQKQQHAGDRGGKSAAKKNAGVFLVHVMGASRSNSVNACSWYYDSGATGHIIPNKQYFVSNTKFANPETIVLGKKKYCCKHTSRYDIHLVSQRRVA